MVKVTAARVESVLRDPDTPVLLIYGPDAGLVRERADRAVSATIGADDDPFRMVTLSAPDLVKDPARLADEMAAQSLIGKAPERELFEKAAELAYAGADPLEQNAYKVPVGKAVLIDALMEAAGLQRR